MKLEEGDTPRSQHTTEARGEAGNRVPYRTNPQKEPTPPTPWSYTVPKTVRKINFLFKPPSSWYFPSAALAN